VVAAGAGGVVELVEPGPVGWFRLRFRKLAAAITTCRQQPELTATIAHRAKLQASQRFQLSAINQQIAQLLSGWGNREHLSRGANLM